MNEKFVDSQYSQVVRQKKNAFKFISHISYHALSQKQISVQIKQFVHS